MIIENDEGTVVFRGGVQKFHPAEDEMSPLTLAERVGLDKYPNLYIDGEKIRCRDCGQRVSVRIFTDEEAELNVERECDDECYQTHGEPRCEVPSVHESSQKDMLDCETVYVCECDPPGEDEHHPKTDFRTYALNSDAIGRDF